MVKCKDFLKTALRGQFCHRRLAHGSWTTTACPNLDMSYRGVSCSRLETARECRPRQTRKSDNQHDRFSRRVVLRRSRLAVEGRRQLLIVIVSGWLITTACSATRRTPKRLSSAPIRHLSFLGCRSCGYSAGLWMRCSAGGDSRRYSTRPEDGDQFRATMADRSDVGSECASTLVALRRNAGHVIRPFAPSTRDGEK